jgi:hypothetical protein
MMSNEHDASAAQAAFETNEETWFSEAPTRPSMRPSSRPTMPAPAPAPIDDSIADGWFLEIPR